MNNGATFSHRHLSAGGSVAGSGANIGSHHNGGAAGLGGARHHSGSSFSTRHAVTAHRPVTGGLGSANGAGNLGVGGHNHHGGVGMSNGVGHHHGGVGGIGNGVGHHHGGVGNGGIGNGLGHHHGNYSGLNHYPRWNWNYGGRHRSVFFFSPFFGGFGFPFIGYSPYGYGYGYNYGYPYYGRSYRRIFPYYGYGGLGYYGYGYSPYSYGNYGYVTNPTMIGQAVAQPTAQPATTASGQFAQQGEMEFKARDYKAAVKSWRHALVDDPQNGVIVLMLGQALFADGQFDEAAGTVQQGLSLLPDDQLGVVVSNYKELYSSVQDYTNQLRALEKAAKAEPDEPGKLFLLGYHYGYLGYPANALKKLDQLLKVAPEDQMAHRLRDLMAAKTPAPEEKSAPDAAAPPAGDARPPAEARLPADAAQR
jgi:Tfp pilus assembly protein PilF